MKQLVCEMCGSTDLVKKDGIFVCQTCGTKYSVEEAKKMMIEGSIKIDRSEHLTNLYNLARRAKGENNIDNAAKYYADILLEDPNSWEATFYSIYYKVQNQKLSETNQSINELSACIKTTFQLIKQYVAAAQWEDIYHEISTSTLTTLTHFSEAAINSGQYLRQEITGQACLACEKLGDLLRSEFSDEIYGLKAYKQALILSGPIDSKYTNLPESAVNRIYQKVRAIEPSYEFEPIESEFKEGTGSEISIGKIQTGHQDYQSLWCIGEPNSAGGNDVKISFRNDSNNDIKYVTFLTEAINAVGDVVPCTLRGNSITRLQATGPYAKNTIQNLYWENVWYNNSVKSARIVGIEIEFINGTKIKIDQNKIKMDSTASSGCYIATAVYGAYDCPQVWMLRRYRDFSLAKSWFGRLFIHIYYAVSPTLVKWFGDTDWFKKMWKVPLDQLVKKLHEQGIEDSPYEDKTW